MLEQLGTSGNDTLTGSNAQDVYGLAGDDLLIAPENTTPTSPIKPQSFLLGGSGSDVYVSRNNVETLIFDTHNSGSDIDILVTESITLNDPNAIFFQMDNRHLVMSNSLSGENVTIIDWHNPENRIEGFTSVTTTDTIISYEVFVNNLPSNGNYLGNIALEEAAEILNIPFSFSEFYADLDAFVTRTQLLEALEV
ncbi:MAG: hypothetical protein QNJ55_31225 [Xenococcus sp. MO_188.B8]|nr:hypothetical protein [Xenococcus sp. MO_188.B8]